MSAKPKPVTLSQDAIFEFDPKTLVPKVFWGFVIAELLLVLGDIVFNFGKLIPIGSIRRFFNIAREDSFATWFASAQILLMAGVVWMVFAVIQQSTGFTARTKKWGLMALFFIYLAMDEGARIHERLGTIFEKLTQGKGALLGETVRHFPSFTWHLIVGPFFIAAGLFIFYFLMKELSRPRLRLGIFFAFACYGLAQGLDFFEGTRNGFSSLALLTSLPVDTVGHFFRVTEEFLEMLGTTFFLTSFLDYLTGLKPSLSISFRQKI